MINSKYYTTDEFTCNCCGELNPEVDYQPLADLLDALCDGVGEKLELSCVYRCPSHNAEIYEELGLPEVTNSQHVVGAAADVQCPEDWTVADIYNMADRLNPDGGVGYYDWGVHVDTRGYAARW